MSLPVVAVVGRPNVGKSTLFNRIVGKREAIVHDLPGVTRDRHIETAEWLNKSFTLIDTGGYVPKSIDEIEIAIREQSELAIQQADKILFVVDYKTGITDHDLAIAEVLKRTTKPVIICVNKVDNPTNDSQIYDFMKLGLGDPFPISATLGRNTGDLLDIITKGMKAWKSVQEDAFNVAIVGRPNVGKSSFINALLNENRHIVSEIAGTTRDSIDTLYNYYNRRLRLIDTAGLRKKARVKESVEFFSNVRTHQAVERADVVVILIDAVDGLTDQDIRIIEQTRVVGKGTLLAVNKWDLVEKHSKTYLEYQKNMQIKLGYFNYIPIIFISAVEKQRLLKVLDLAEEIHSHQQQKISTSNLNDYFQSIFKVSPPPSKLGKEISIKYVTQLKVNPPVFGFFSNKPKLIPVNYRRFLEKKIRENYPFPGVHIRLVFKEK